MYIFLKLKLLFSIYKEIVLFSIYIQKRMSTFSRDLFNLVKEVYSHQSDSPQEEAISSIMGCTFLSCLRNILQEKGEEFSVEFFACFLFSRGAVFSVTGR